MEKEFANIYTGLQSYVHYRYNNYTPTQNAALNRERLLSTVLVNKQDLKGLETRLNRYYLNKGNLQGIVPQEVLNKFNKIIEEKLGTSRVNKSINFETLGNQNSKFAEQAWGNFSRQVDLGKTKFKLQTAEKALREIKNRMSYLVNEETQQNIEKEIVGIESIIKDLGERFATDTYVPRSDAQAETLAQKIQYLESVLSGGSATVHGAYAEYVVALMAACVESKGKSETEKMLKDFQKNLENIGGTRTQAAFSMGNDSYFGTSNINTIMGNRKQKHDVASNIVYTSNFTQDKVDVNIQFKGKTIPTSVKNYNLANTNFDKISLLSGTGILALLNQEARFVNHWLNISPIRQGLTVSQAPSGEKSTVDSDMKFLLAYRGMVGGRLSAQGQSAAAKVLVINDNSQGRFRVFRVSSLLRNISNDLSLIDIKTSPNLFEMKNEWVGESMKNSENAYSRVTNLLAELNRIKIHISMDKKLIKPAFGY